MNDASEQNERATVTKTISLPDDLLEKARQRSKKENRSFSSYVANLISRDLGTAPAPDKQAA